MGMSQEVNGDVKKSQVGAIQAEDELCYSASMCSTTRHQLIGSRLAKPGGVDPVLSVTRASVWKRRSRACRAINQVKES